MEIKNCPFCQSSAIQEIMVTEDFSYSKEKYRIGECSSCNFRFTTNPPDEDQAYKYYQGDNYISHSDTKDSLMDKIYHRVRDFMLNLKFKKLKKHVTGDRILDLGSGTGYFLNHLKQRDYKVEGIEMSEEARALALKNFNIQSSEPQHFFSLDGESKDAITMWHVLEHLYDLPKYFTQFNKVIKTNGHLIIAVPNHKSVDAAYYKEYWAAYDVPRHLWHFNPNTLMAWGEKYGFSLKAKYKMPFDPFYNSLLSEGYKKSVLASLRAIIIGKISLIKSILNINQSSSIIYVFEKERNTTAKK